MVKCKTTNFVEERIGINPHKHGVVKIIIIKKIQTIKEENKIEIHRY